MEHWEHTLAGAGDVGFAREAVAEVASYPALARHRVRLSDVQRERLGEPVEAREALLIAAFQGLVYKYAGRGDLLLSVERHGESVCPLRVDVRSDLTLRSYAGRVQAALTLARSLAAPPPETWTARLGVGVRSAPEHDARPRLEGRCSELFFEVYLESDELALAVHYDGSRLSARQIARIADAYVAILQQALERDLPIRELQLISKEDRRRILHAFNDTDCSFEDETFHGLFEAQALRVPDVMAVVDEQTSYSYAELNARANQLAHALIARGVRPNDVVGMVLGRSVDAFVAIFGIMKAGAAYLPIEPSFPEARMHFMLCNSRCNFAIVDASTRDKLPTGVEPIGVRTGELEELARSNPQLPLGRDGLAYVIYTSGSTGEPKGVTIHHEGVANLHHIHRQRFQIDERDRMVEFASFSFDTSVWEIVMSLLAGATLHVLSEALKANYARLEQYLNEHRITVATFPPTFLSYLSPERLPTLRAVAVAGSECPAKLLRAWNERVAFYNAYGPTEHSVCIAVFDAPRTHFDGDVVPIGRPLANKRIYIVGVDGQLQPIGAPGELWVSGVGQSRGYLGRPELTHERFVANPFAESVTGPRAAHHRLAYRTGDLARFREDGCLEFLGRTDNQVKVRGYRIELDEVDSALMKVPGVVQAGALVKPDASGANVLCAFYTARQELTPVAVRAALQQRMPEFMIPSRLRQIETMPMTNSDKVDRKALTALDDREQPVWEPHDAEGPSDPIVSELCAITSSVMEWPVASETSLERTQLQLLGVDSLQFMKIVVALEGQYDVELGEDFLLHGRTLSLQEIAQLIKDRKVS
jgi:amino acid adenylation domain-containing protein